MITYKAFAELSLSSNSDERGYAAHLAALAYINHQGPAAEHAALYAALIGFLDDSSVKVRAALAYGLLHSPEAPRPVILSLLQDSDVIARAVLQYSPVLVDADLFGIVERADPGALQAIAQRAAISPRLAAALIARADQALILRLVRRQDVAIPAAVLENLATATADDAQMRGALLARPDLPAAARLVLVRQVTERLQACRLVKGALDSGRLGKLLRDGADAAVAAIGEAEIGPSRDEFVESLVETRQLTTRLLLHSVVTGRVAFFVSCVARLADAGSSKVFTLLETGSKASLTALFARCGLSIMTNRLMVRLVLLARTADLADDVAARHYVINALTEELVTEYGGDIPHELEEVFSYLNEQNIALARKAARGVMAAFAQTTDTVTSAWRQLPAA
jgi:Uncharacterized protein conserved in bacteria